MVSVTMRRDGGVDFRDARRPRLVAQQPSEALGGKTFLPAPDAGLGLTRLAHDRVCAEPFGAQQYDPGPPDVFLCGVAIAVQAAKSIKIGSRDG